MSDVGAIGLALAVAGIATPFVIVWLRQRALAKRAMAARPPTEVERAARRKRNRQSIVVFALFWPTSLSLVLATELIQPSEPLRIAVVILFVVLLAGMVTFHMSTRCPVCEYRLGYQRSLGVPLRCERCGADFS